MIIGTVATSQSVVASSSGPDLSSALVAIDFSRQRYFLSGTEVSLASILDRTDMTIGADGAVFDWGTSDQPARFLPAAISALGTDGFSLVFKWKDREETANQNPLVLQNNDSNPGYIWVESDQTFVTAWVDDQFISNSLFDLNVPPQTSANPRRVGITRTVAGGFRASFNGSAVQTLGPAGSFIPPYDEISIGGWYENSTLSANAAVQWLIFYPAVSDSELQALTDL